MTKIATFNINGINGRLPILLKWLEQTKPDIVCLQELKAPDDRFPSEALKAAGYHAAWLGQKSWNGVAILSRNGAPVVTRRNLIRSAESRYIEAAVDGILVGCLYAPNGNPVNGPKFPAKLEWYRHLKAHADALRASDVPVVLAGDFNVMPTDIDVYNPTRWEGDALFRPEIRDAYVALVESGWTDALRTFFGDQKIYTFWQYFRNAFARDAGLRIDHFLLTQDLAARLTGAGVDRDVRGWEGSSDHAPTWIVLQNARKRRSRR
jgi:exodeoxyribonuclease-3